jgi:MFS family permease
MPAIGAILMGFLIAHRPPIKHAGSALLWSVAGFGAATIIFGVSEIYWLSLAMLFATGAFDAVSVVVRHTLVQTRTPDALRGRVSAVNSLFISCSNEFGEFESGMVAAWFGPVASVVLGGVGTIAVVTGVVKLWPGIRKLGPLHEATVSRPA